MTFISVTLVGYMLDIKVLYLDQEEHHPQRGELLRFLPGHFALDGVNRYRPIWEWDNKRIFLVKRAYFSLYDGGLRCPYTKIIWRINVPIKIRAFLWLVINKAILIWENLMKKSWLGPSICVLYKLEESIDHLFFRCPYSTQIWEQLAQYLNLSIPVLPQTMNHLWTSWRHFSINKRDILVWDLWVAAIFWRYGGNTIIDFSIIRPNQPSKLFMYV